MLHVETKKYILFYKYTFSYDRCFLCRFCFKKVVYRKGLSDKTCFTSMEQYPHSLSYHASTFTRFPSTTFVKCRSAMEPGALPMMSVETRGCSETEKIPFQKSSCAACLKISLISSREVFLLAIKVKSITEPVITGTLIAMPSNLPFISGTAFSVAIAAPVVEGTMLTAAARPRVQSFLSGPSTIAWVAVYPCTVLRIAFSMPGFCIKIVATGVVALVVQEALDVIRTSFIFFSPTCGVTVMVSSSSAGAVITTRLAPALMCAFDFSEVAKTPVDSITISMSSFFHGSSKGSFICRK